MKQSALLVAFIGLVVFLKHEVDTGQIELELPHQDQVVALQAELARLRVRLTQCNQGVSNITGLPTFYIVTPTHSRSVQLAELTRLRSVFLLVPNLHWVLVEDSNHKTELVKYFLENSGLPHTHLNVATPEAMKLKSKDPHWSKPRGVEQRNLGVQWLRENRKGEQGVVYFADDDNTYSPELFEALRNTKKLTVFPVGLVGGLLVERPLASSSGGLAGWSVQWGRDRPFATDMAGFAVNLEYLLSRPKAKFLGKVKIGYLESEFLKLLIGEDGDEAVEVIVGDQLMVWHTRTEKVNLNMEEKFKARTGHGSDHGLRL